MKQDKILLWLIHGIGFTIIGMSLYKLYFVVIYFGLFWLIFTYLILAIPLLYFVMEFKNNLIRLKE